MNLCPYYVFWTTVQGEGTFLIPLSWVSVHIWSPHFLHGKFMDVFECPRSMLFENHSMDVILKVDGVFSLVAEQPFSSPSFSMEPSHQAQVGKEESNGLWLN